jgi:hypothetical protein
MNSKTCRTCKTTKPLSEFYKQTKRGADGVRGSCKECVNLVKKAYREKNRDKLLVEKKLDYHLNKERYLENKKQYRQENKGRINALCAARKQVVKQRTPKWLDKISFERIRNEYRLAALLTKVTGQSWHVDHVIPLQGKYVSGLHVPSNLQVMLAAENISKKNKFEVKYA